jgi:RNA polymerase sigma-70 factor, ECF subfamily
VGRYAIIGQMIASEALSEVRAAFERAQRRYPTIDLPLEVFLARVDEIVASNWPSEGAPERGPWLAAFASLHHSDLFLVLACASGNRIAWEYFADDYLADLRRWAAQAAKSMDRGEELAQELVTQLLGESAAVVTGPGLQGTGRLSGYSGRGSLGAWLRVSVSRAAIDRFRQIRREVPLEDAGPQVENLSGQADPALGLNGRWISVLSNALAGEVARLSDRDRLLLSLYYLKGVPLRVIGVQFGAHEATVSRWLDRIRESLRKGVERELKRRHGLRPRDIEPLWKKAAEEGAFSLETMLRSG